MHILLSVKPKFAERIFDGTKKYEYRKTIFRRQDIDGVLVYASSPIKLVVGEFKIEEILHDDVGTLWSKTEANAGMSKDSFFKYFAHKSRGYAIKIKTMRMYHVPIFLNHLMISTPPQSFCYLDDLKTYTRLNQFTHRSSNNFVMHSNLVQFTR